MKTTIFRTIYNIITGAIQFDKSLRLMAQHPFAVYIGAAQNGCYVTDYVGIDEETGRHGFDAVDYEPENQIDGRLITDHTPIPMPDGTTLTREEFTQRVLETIAELQAIMELQEEQGEEVEPVHTEAFSALDAALAEELSEGDSDGDEVSFSDTPGYEHEVGNLF